jgi:hypothetical protein
MAQVEQEERTSADITEAEKVLFLQYIRQGLDRREAAHVLGYKARPWRAITSPQSPFYDEDFSRAYGEATRSPEYQINYMERLREEVNRRAMTGSDRLLEKLAMVHLPEWQVLRQKEVNVSVSVLVERVFKGLPKERLEQILQWLDEQDADEIEVGEFAEITAGSNEHD